jgi:hypothetical protein
MINNTEQSTPNTNTQLSLISDIKQLKKNIFTLEEENNALKFQLEEEIQIFKKQEQEAEEKKEFIQKFVFNLNKIIEDQNKRIKSLRARLKDTTDYLNIMKDDLFNDIDKKDLIIKELKYNKKQDMKIRKNLLNLIEQQKKQIDKLKYNNNIIMI